MILKKYTTAQKTRLLCIVSAIFAILFGIWQAILVCIYFEADNGIYAASSPSRTPLYSVMLIFCLFIIAFVFSELPKEKNTDPQIISPEPTTVKIFRIVCSLGLLSGSTVKSIAIITGKISIELPNILIALLILLPILFVLYFIPELFLKFQTDHKDNLPTAYYYCGMLGIVWLLLDSLSLYVDYSTPVASDYRTFTEISLLMFTLFFASELRQKLSVPKQRYHIIITCISSVCCGALYIGKLALCFTGKTSFGNELANTLIGISLVIYIFTRLYLSAHTVSNEQNEGSESTPNNTINDNGDSEKSER